MNKKLSTGFAATAAAAVIVLAASGCGSDAKKDEPAVATPAVTATTFADIKPIIIASCATANCHVKGKTSPDYSAVTEATWKAADQGTVGKSMPPKSSTQLTAAELAKFTGYTPK